MKILNGELPIEFQSKELFFTYLEKNKDRRPMNADLKIELNLVELLILMSNHEKRNNNLGILEKIVNKEEFGSVLWGVKMT